jgi:cytochrome P450
VSRRGPAVDADSDQYLTVRTFAPQWLPIPTNRRFDEAAARFRRVVAEVIAAARAEGKDHGDLLSMLLLARDHVCAQFDTRDQQ